ncbi:MAG: hypothetical protein ACK5U4_02120, partial [Rhodospirillales bacterium]
HEVRNVGRGIRIDQQEAHKTAYFLGGVGTVFPLSAESGRFASQSGTGTLVANPLPVHVFLEHPL